jgi:hypothetical protein
MANAGTFSRSSRTDTAPDRRFSYVCAAMPSAPGGASDNPYDDTLAPGRSGIGSRMAWNKPPDALERPHGSPWKRPSGSCALRRLDPERNGWSWQHFDP